MKRILTILCIVVLFLCFSNIALSAAVINMSGKIDAKTREKLDQGKSRVDVIVLLSEYRNYAGKIKSDQRADIAKKHASIRSLQDTVLNKVHPSHLKLKHRFGNFPGFSARVTQEGILTLASLSEVSVIEEDEMVEAQLAQGISLINAYSTRYLHNGTGVSVAIVDTGIDYNHPMLGGSGFPNSKVIGGYDFGDDDFDPLDCQGHGTSVAGIAAGTPATGPEDYVGGVAYNAKLYALKIVAGCGGSALTSDIVAAWDWAVSHKNDDPDNPILIINTSFGGGKYLSACDSDQPALAAAADNAVANGITLFASSGNNAYIDGIASPACVSNAISVGAVYDADIGYHGNSICTDTTTAADKVTCYSNSSGFLDILAPGHDAYTAAVGGGYITNFGGTSAASAYAAGVGALVQSNAKAVTGSYYLPGELKTRLVNGDQIADPRNNIIKPRINAAAPFSVLKTDVPPAIDGDVSEFADAKALPYRRCQERIRPLLKPSGMMKPFISHMK
jgi:subtilisin family serine protease